MASWSGSTCSGPLPRPARWSLPSRGTGRSSALESLLAPAQLFLSLEDAALDTAQSLELLPQRFLALVALNAVALTLAESAAELAGETHLLLRLHDDQRRDAAVARLAGLSKRLEKLR